jgi:hypothetical protein
MMIDTILMKKKPFHKDNDEVTMPKIINGERPDLSLLEKRKCGFVSIIRENWKDDSNERLWLMDLKDKVIEVNIDGATVDDDESETEEGLI